MKIYLLCFWVTTQSFLFANGSLWKCQNLTLIIEKWFVFIYAHNPTEAMGLFVCFSDPVIMCLIVNLEATGSFQRKTVYLPTNSG